MGPRAAAAISTSERGASGWSTSPVAPAPASASAEPRSPNAAMAGTRLRPHWQQAAIAMSRSRSIRLARRAASSRTTLRRVAASTMRATPSSTAFSTTHSSLSVAIHACTSVTATDDSRSTGSWRVSSTCCPRAASRPWNSPPRPLNSTTASPSRKRSTCAAWCATFAGNVDDGAGGEVGLDEEAGFSHVARPGKKKGRRMPARSSVSVPPQAARSCGTRGVLPDAELGGCVSSCTKSGSVNSAWCRPG